MRSRFDPQRNMLTNVDLEEQVPKDHPLRRIKEMIDVGIAQLSPTFDCMYASVSPERLLKTSLPIALYAVRSECAFCEELAYNLPCRLFSELDLLVCSFDATVCTKNLLRLPAQDAGRARFDEVVWAAHQEGLLSDEHFNVDGTLIGAAVLVGELPAISAAPNWSTWSV